jgi:hypothetical protein
LGQTLRFLLIKSVFTNLLTAEWLIFCVVN